MKTPIALLGWVSMILFPSLAVAHVDGMTLLVSVGRGPGEVRLDWSGGQPTFQVYRSTTPIDVTTPVNLIGESDLRTWLDVPGPGGIFFYEITSPYDLKADPGNFDNKKGLFTRYGVFGHFQSCDSTDTCSDPLCPDAEGARPDLTRSGLAEVLGNDWMVTLGAFPTPSTLSVKNTQDSATTAHELGHNLGLRHGGPDCTATDPSCTYDPNQDRKVNYLSVMNYWYQFGIPVTAIPGSISPSGVKLDFSHVALPTLDEANLDETAGVSPGNPPPYDTYLIKYLTPPVGLTTRYGSTSAGHPIDWDSDLVLEVGVAVDLNNNGILEVHSGADDWGHLKHAFQCGANFED